MKNLFKICAVFFGGILTAAFLLSDVEISTHVKKAFAQVGQLQSGQIWGNPTGSQAPAEPTTVGAIIDESYTCTAQGSVIYRGGSLWTCLAPGTSGLPLLSQGASANLHYALMPVASLAVGTQDTVIGYFGSTTASALAINNCSNALTYSTSTHAFGCNAGAGTGTVTSVTPGAGLVSSVTASCSQTAVTTSGTLSKAECVNAQSGTSYIILDGDRSKLITATNAAAQAYSIAQAGAASAFQAGWYVDIRNNSSNPAGIVTVTPTTSTINNGAASLLIYPGQSVRIFSDGTNYQTTALAGAGPVLLNTLTASSSATLSDTTSLTAAYSIYEIVFENIVPATTNETCEIQVHSGGSIQTSGYITGTLANAGTSTIIATTPATFIQCSIASNVTSGGPGINGLIRVYTPSTSALHMWTGSFSHLNTSNIAIISTGGYWNTSGVIDGFQVCMSSSTPTCNINITSGTIKIYGYP